MCWEPQPWERGPLEAISSFPIIVQPREEREQLRLPSLIWYQPSGTSQTHKAEPQSQSQGCRGQQATFLPGCLSHCSNSCPRERVPRSPYLAPVSPHTCPLSRPGDLVSPCGPCIGPPTPFPEWLTPTRARPTCLGTSTSHSGGEQQRLCPSSSGKRRGSASSL